MILIESWLPNKYPQAFLIHVEFTYTNVKILNTILKNIKSLYSRNQFRFNQKTSIVSSTN